MSSTRTVGDSRLVLHCGANVCSWDDVKAVKTPEPTDSHCPISHAFLVQEVRNGLNNMGFNVTEEVHAMWGGGLRYFGLLGLQERTGGDIGYRQEVSQGRQFVFGIRNGNDRTIVAGGALGTRVFVCDNLMLHSDQEEFKFARKHTRYAVRDLPGLIASNLGGLRLTMKKVTEREDAYANFDFDKADEKANVKPGTVLNDTLMRCLRARAFNVQSLPHIIREYERHDAPGGHFCAGDAWQQPTAWRLQQAVTEVEKTRPGLLNISQRHNRLTGVLDAVAFSRS